MRRHPSYSIGCIRLAFLAVTLFSTITEAQQPPVFDPQAETEAYLSRLSPEEQARSDAYFEGGYWLQLVGLAYGLAVAWFLLASGLSRWLRDAAERMTRFRFARSSLYVVGYSVITFLLAFPLTFYQGFVREHRYQLANQSFGPWMRDQLVGLAVGILLGALALSLLYVAIRKAGRHWWLWGAGGGLAFLVFSILISPFSSHLFSTSTGLWTMLR